MAVLRAHTALIIINYLNGVTRCVFTNHRPVPNQLIIKALKDATANTTTGNAFFNQDYFKSWFRNASSSSSKRPFAGFSATTEDTSPGRTRMCNTHKPKRKRQQH
ncbi:MAG: hypothetical protein R3E73_04590 [Porticoccaceae bacterium]